MIGTRSRALRCIGLIVLLSLAQLGLMYVALTAGMRWLFIPLWPGLQSMHFLPADPQSAGSFIVFPTLAQLILAIGVNDLIYGSVIYGISRIRLSR
jgi:hypothetical protein